MTCCNSIKDLGRISKSEDRFVTELVAPVTGIIVLRYDYAGSNYAYNVIAEEGVNITFKNLMFPDLGVVDFVLEDSSGDKIEIDSFSRFGITII